MATIISRLATEDSILETEEGRVSKTELRKLYRDQALGVYDDALIGGVWATFIVQVEKLLEEVRDLAEGEIERLQEEREGDWAFEEQVEDITYMLTLLREAKTPQQKMVAIDHAIQECHHTGQYGEFLIEGMGLSQEQDNAFYEELSTMEPKESMRKKARTKADLRTLLEIVKDEIAPELEFDYRIRISKDEPFASNHMVGELGMVNDTVFVFNSGFLDDRLPEFFLKGIIAHELLHDIERRTGERTTEVKEADPLAEPEKDPWEFHIKVQKAYALYDPALMFAIESPLMKEVFGFNLPWTDTEAEARLRIRKKAQIDKQMFVEVITMSKNVEKEALQRERLKALIAKEYISDISLTDKELEQMRQDFAKQGILDDEKKTCVAITDWLSENWVDKQPTAAQAQEETEGPVPGDYIIGSSGPLGSLTTVGIFEGPFLGEFKTEEDAEKAILADMKSKNLYSNVWIQDDHGGYTLTTLEKTAQDPPPVPLRTGDSVVYQVTPKLLVEATISSIGGDTATLLLDNGLTVPDVRLAKLHGKKAQFTPSVSPMTEIEKGWELSRGAPAIEEVMQMQTTDVAGEEVTEGDFVEDSSAPEWFGEVLDVAVPGPTVMFQEPKMQMGVLPWGRVKKVSLKILAASLAKHDKEHPDEKPKYTLVGTWEDMKDAALYDCSICGSSVTVKDEQELLAYFKAGRIDKVPPSNPRASKQAQDSAKGQDLLQKEVITTEDFEGEWLTVFGSKDVFLKIPAGTAGRISTYGPRRSSVYFNTAALQEANPTIIEDLEEVWSAEGDIEYCQHEITGPLQQAFDSGKVCIVKVPTSILAPKKTSKQAQARPWKDGTRITFIGSHPTHGDTLLGHSGIILGRSTVSNHDYEIKLDKALASGLQVIDARQAILRKIRSVEAQELDYLEQDMLFEDTDPLLDEAEQIVDTLFEQNANMLLGRDPTDEQIQTSVTQTGRTMLAPEEIQAVKESYQARWDKLEGKVSKKTAAVEVPPKVLEGIMSVRDSGAINMLDRDGVADLCDDWGCPEAADWIREHRSEYARLIFEGPEEEGGKKASMLKVNARLLSQDGTRHVILSATELPEIGKVVKVANLLYSEAHFYIEDQDGKYQQLDPELERQAESHELPEEKERAFQVIQLGNYDWDNHEPLWEIKETSNGFTLDRMLESTP